MKYDVQDMYDIKDDIKRASYIHKYFWDDYPQAIEKRIDEYLTLIQDGTFDDNRSMKIQTMIAMLTSINMNKDSIKNYHLLYYTIVMEYMELMREGNNPIDLPINEERGHELLSGLRKDGYYKWKRITKLNKIINNLR